MTSTSNAITVRLDGRPRLVPEGCTLASLLESVDLPPNGVATAVNGQFVARGHRDNHLLHDGDAVLLFQPIVGG